MSEQFERFSACLSLSDQLVEEASKKEIAAVARVLALLVAHYRKRYTPIPLQDSLLMMIVPAIDDERATMLADGVEVLIDAIRAVAIPAGPRESGC